MYYLVDENKMRPVIDTDTLALRRQDLPPVYALNGAVYAVQVKWFMKNKKLTDKNTIAHCMPKERSIDIDDEFDLQIFRAMVTSAFSKDKET